MLTPHRAEQRAAYDMLKQVQPQCVVVFVRSVYIVMYSFHAGSHIADRRGEAQYLYGWLTLPLTSWDKRQGNPV